MFGCGEGGYDRGYILSANRVLIENFNYSMSCFGTNLETDLADPASPSPISNTNYYAFQQET